MKRLRLFFVNYLTRHLVKAIGEEDIITITGKRYFINRRKLSEEEMDMLKAQAESFLDSDLYRLMKKDVEFQAYLRMGAKATVPEDITFGKAVFYALSLIDQYLQRMKSL